MALKDLLVAYDGSASADAALHVGASMVRAFGAKLTALLAHGAAADYAAQARWIGHETREVLRAANAAALDDARERFRARASAEGLADVPLFDEIGRPDLIVAEYAKFYDLTLLGCFDTDATDMRLILHPDRIALRSGRPLLIVPAEAEGKAVLHGRVLVAWDGSRSAARAISNALRILETRSTVMIVTVGEGAQPAPGRNIETHLANHGVEADWVRLPRKGDIAGALLDHADTSGADVMVMGAYEHSKFREDFFGGVTDAVLRRTRLPILLSH